MKSIPFVVPKSFYERECLNVKIGINDISVNLIQPPVSQSPELDLSKWTKNIG